MDEAPQDDIALQERVVCLQFQQQSECELHQLLEQKATLALRRSELTARSLAEQLKRDKAALAREVAVRDFELTKGRVELLRWRQKAALLKVQMSSAQEDVGRYRRISEILQAQYALERESGAAAQKAAIKQSQRAGRLEAELVGAQAELQERERKLADLQLDLERQLEAAHQVVGQLREENAELQCQRSAAEAAAAQQQAAAEEAQRQAAEAVRQVVGQLREENAQMQCQRSDAQAAAEEAQRRAADLQQQVAAKLSDIASLQSQLSAEEKLVLDLRAQLESKCAHISELEEKVAMRTVGAFIQLESPALAEPRAASPPAAAAGPEGQDQDAAPAATGQLHLVSTAAAAPHTSVYSADTEPLQKEHEEEEEEAPAAARKRKAASNVPGQRKRKSKQAEEREAAGEGDHGSDGQPAAGARMAAGRPRRDRGKAVPYWMGPQQQEAEAGASDRQQPAVLGLSALDRLATAAAGAADSAEAEQAGAQAGTQAERPAEPAVNEDQQQAPVQQPAEEGPRRRGRRGGAQSEHEATQAGQGDAPKGEARHQKEKGRKGQQLKRPQGEIKTNLANVWGGATPVLPFSDGTTDQGPKAAKLIRKSNLGPKNEVAAPQHTAAAMAAAAAAAEAAGSSRHHQGQVAGAVNENDADRLPASGSQASAAQLPQQEVSSRVLEHPLGALNQRTLAAAANRLQGPAGPTKSTLQKAIAARSEQQQQPQKRRLLPVTNALAASTGDAVPTNVLFGGKFKVPRLAK